jgi:hypothetical protein
MPLDTLLGARYGSTMWASIRLKDDCGSVYDRLVFMRQLALRVIPAARVRLNNKTIRVFLPEGFDATIKEKILSMGVKSVFVDGRIATRPRQDALAPIAAAQAAERGAHQECEAELAAARAKGEDVRILRADAPGTNIVHALATVGRKIGEVVKIFADVGALLVRVTHSNMSAASVVKVGPFALLTTPLMRL